MEQNRPPQRQVNPEKIIPLILTGFNISDLKGSDNGRLIYVPIPMITHKTTPSVNNN